MNNQDHLVIIPEQSCRKSEIIIAGDIHGDLQSFENVVKLFNPQRNLLFFLGDYADRGPNGVEVIKGVSELLISFPNRVFALQGNHEMFTSEGEPTFRPFTLRQEVHGKNQNWKDYFFNQLKPFLDKLKLGILIPGEVLFVHGGISPEITTIQDIRNPTCNTRDNILWSDPTTHQGVSINRRGIGVEFGPDVTEQICERLDIKHIVRSHEPQKAISGPYLTHSDRVITISTTRLYGGRPFVLILNGNSLAADLTNLSRSVRFLF